MEFLKRKEALVLFYANWCPFCRRFKPIFEKHAKKHCIKIALDDEENALWERMKINFVPTVIFYKNGKEIKRLEAKPGIGISENEIIKFLKEL